MFEDKYFTICHRQREWWLLGVKGGSEEYEDESKMVQAYKMTKLWRPNMTLLSNGVCDG